MTQGYVDVTPGDVERDYVDVEGGHVDVDEGSLNYQSGQGLLELFRTTSKVVSTESSAFRAVPCRDLAL